VVAAMRETSILFGTLIAGLILHESMNWARLAGAIIIVVGAAVLRIT